MYPNYIIFIQSAIHHTVLYTMRIIIIINLPYAINDGMDISVVTAVYIVERVILEKNEKLENKPRVHCKGE